MQDIVATQTSVQSLELPFSSQLVKTGGGVEEDRERERRGRFGLGPRHGPFCDPMGGLGSGGPRGGHEGVSALLLAPVLAGGGVSGRDHDGVLVHQLAGGVGEGGQWQGDALHLALVHALLVVLLQVATPAGGHRGQRSEPAVR